MILFHEIAQIVALMIFDIHSFGDTLLPRVHTASQQAHGKLKIDSVRFYTHKFLQVSLRRLASTAAAEAPRWEFNRGHLAVRSGWGILIRTS